MAVGGEARPVARAAERLGHRGDDPDLPTERAPVLLENIVDERGPLAALVQAARVEAKLLLQAGPNTRRGEHLQLLAPAVSLEGHVLDEPHLARHVPGEGAGEVDHLV